MTALPDSITLFHAAANLASRLHQHQLRKDGRTPYVSHLMRVPLILATVFHCQDPVVLAAGMLHDVIEDTTGDYDEIAETAGSEVARLVAALTKDMRMPEKERELAYDQQLRDAPWQVRLIKLADVYDNLCDSVLSKSGVKVVDKARRALELAGDDPHLQDAVAALRKLADPLT
jgi:(p)ppGpp synthase/HD superfamily hydrolase